MAADLRIYLCGRVAIERSGHVVAESALPGRQGRLALAYLTLERHRPVPRDELADVLWAGALPASWDVSLSAVVSKLRRAFSQAGLDGARTLDTAFGCYGLKLPPGSEVDFETAQLHLEEAEKLIAEGDLRSAYMPARVAYQVTRRSFLPGDDGPWVEEQRKFVSRLLVRSLVCAVRTAVWAGESPTAIALAEEAVTADPFNEEPWRLLMEAQAGDGNRAGALRTWERLRGMLADELGADPSPETHETYLNILRRTARTRG